MLWSLSASLITSTRMSPVAATGTGTSGGGPRLSVVLAVHGEQAYLPECAASVLEAGVEDVELVAVDDASRDHGPELLDELTTTKVVHLALPR